MPNRSYSFKEGLAMMAAKDVGIDPYLAAEAGEDARSILAALRRAKTAKGQDKVKHIAAAQAELRKLNPKQHGKLINALQAKVLALQGRGGDTAVAHLEPGEMVVPRRVLTPELMQVIASEAAKRGIDLKQLIVGIRRASINPATGAEEFGLLSRDEDELEIEPITVSATRRTERLTEVLNQPSFTLGKALSDNAGREHPNPLMNRQRNPLTGTEGQTNFPGQDTYDQANRFRLEAHINKDNWQERKPWLDDMAAYAQLEDGSEAKKQRAAEIIDRSWQSDKPYDPFLVNVRKQVSVNSEASGQYPWLTNKGTHEKLFNEYETLARVDPEGDRMMDAIKWVAKTVGGGLTGVGVASLFPKKVTLPALAKTLGRASIPTQAAIYAGEYLYDRGVEDRRQELRNSFEEQYGEMPRINRD